MAEGAVLEIPGGSDRIVREDAAFRDNLRISLSVPERESSPTHVCVCVCNLKCGHRLFSLWLRQGSVQVTDLEDCPPDAIA
jgi:hypothetical protein